MDNREKKEELLKYRESVREADRLEDEIRRWYARAEQMTAVVRLTPSGGSGGRSLEDAVGSIDELAAQLAQKQRENVGRRRRIESAIGQVRDGRLQELLRRRYINGDTWEKVAAAMGYQYRWVLALHARAISEIKTL